MNTGLRPGQADCLGPGGGFAGGPAGTGSLVGRRVAKRTARPFDGATKWGVMGPLEPDLEVDFMDTRDGRRLPCRAVGRLPPGFVPVAGHYLTVGCEDAEPAVARVLSVNADGDIELEVLPGEVGSHRDLLALS